MEMCGRLRTPAASSPGKEPSVAGVATFERKKLYGPCRVSEYDFLVF